MQILVVRIREQWRVAAVFDPAAGAVRPNSAGLFERYFLGGVAALDGHRRFPEDGQAFIAALYDELILTGHLVHWLRSIGIPQESAEETRPTLQRENRRREER